MALARENYFCFTKGKLLSFTYKWAIDNFSYFEVGDILESPEFTVGAENDESRWILILRRSEMLICLKCISCKNSLVRVKYNFAILNSKNVEKDIKAPIIQKFKEGELKWETIDRDKLFKENSGLLPNDTLTILCKASILTNISKISGKQNLVIPDCKLNEDLKNLFENEIFSDVILVICNQEIKAHKNILAARSAVFAAMFSHEMKEQQSNRVIITDIDFDVLKAMLLFIYTGQTPNIDQIAINLLAAADKYQLQDLKAMCENTCYKQLTVDNAADTLILADLHGANQLKSETIKFISNHAVDVMKTTGWLKVMTEHPHIASCF